jgi:hypothetical protein
MKGLREETIISLFARCTEKEEIKSRVKPNHNNSIYHIQMLFMVLLSYRWTTNEAKSVQKTSILFHSKYNSLWLSATKFFKSPCKFISHMLHKNTKLKI